MINNRQAGRRNRGRNNNNNGRPNGGNRGGGDNGNRIDNRARGNAAQLLEKYKNMARDAQMAGDRVNAEYYLQFADHYFRVLADNRSRQEEQQQRFLPPTFRGEMVWCQLFSEPGAGSDLAGLSTKATKVDGGWRITGQKIWTTAAQFSQWGALLARTDPNAPKHNGITYFLLDMKSEGVTVKPLRELTGQEFFNTVYIDDVFVPDEYVLGEVNRGWEVSRNTLTAERVSIGGSDLNFLASLPQFVEFVRDGHFDQVARHRAGQLIAEGHAAKVLNLRSTLLTLAGGDAMPSAAISKLLSMRTGQGYAEFAVSSFGTDAVIGDPHTPQGKWGEFLLSSRATTIYGGTSEVQLNIIAERLLGLPRDP